MAKWKASEWTEIKELTPLQFMPYMAKLFREVTRKDLQGLSQFTGWIGLGGYYRWRVAQQGLLHLVPHLQGQPTPRTPDARPSGRPLPPRPARTKTPAAGASAKQQDRVQPTPDGSGQGSTQTRVESRPPLARAESLPPPARVGSHPLPTRAVSQPPQAEVGYQPPREVLSTLPQVEEEWVMVPGPTGTK